MASLEYAFDSLHLFEAIARSSETATERKNVMTKRETIDTGTDKRYVRRDEKGQFKESVDVGKSLSADRRHKAQTEAKPGEGDRGDRHTKH
jgi:hypothetical protein